MNRSQLTQKFVDHGYKSSTSSVYAATLIGFNHGMNIPDDKKWVSKSLVKEVMDKELKPTSKRNILSAMIAFLKLYKTPEGDPVYELLGYQRDVLNKEYIANANKIGIQKKPDAGTMKEGFDNAHEDLNKLGFFKQSGFIAADIVQSRVMELVVFLFYMYPFSDPESNFAPLRNDLCTFHLRVPRETNPSVNTFYPKSGKKPGRLRLVDHKTVDKTGPYDVELPDFVNGMLATFIRRMGVKPGELIFPHLKKTSITQILNKLSRRYIGSSISTQLLRRYYVSMRFSDDKAQREEVAKNMGHNLEVQDKIYTY